MQVDDVCCAAGPSTARDCTVLCQHLNSFHFKQAGELYSVCKPHALKLLCDISAMLRMKRVQSLVMCAHSKLLASHTALTKQAAGISKEYTRAAQMDPNALLKEQLDEATKRCSDMQVRMFCRAQLCSWPLHTFTLSSPWPAAK